MANELYRQGVHLSLGLLSVLLAFFISKEAFLWYVIILGACCFIFVYFAHDSKWLYLMFEREDAAFRGKGALFFCLGIFLTAVLFWDHASEAILLLAVPDAIATITGTIVKSPALPYNHRKSIAGSFALFLSSVIILSFTLHNLSVFLIAFLLAALESFDYREIPFLDDNLVIPLIAGFLLSLA